MTERFRTLQVCDRNVFYEQVVTTASDGCGVAASDIELIAKKKVEDLSKLPVVKIGQLQEWCKVMVEDAKKDMVDIDLGRGKGREIVVRDVTGSITFTATTIRLRSAKRRLSWSGKVLCFRIRSCLSQTILMEELKLQCRGWS